MCPSGQPRFLSVLRYETDKLRLTLYLFKTIIVLVTLVMVESKRNIQSDSEYVKPYVR